MRQIISPKNFSRSSRPRRGFGMMLTLTAIVFIATAMVAVSGEFATQARRTRGLTQSAQQRQLFTAATSSLLMRLSDPQNADKKSIPAFTLALPPELGDAKITVTPDPASLNTYSFAATVSNSTARQSVTIERENGRARLISAELSPDIH